MLFPQSPHPYEASGFVLKQEVRNMLLLLAAFGLAALILYCAGAL